MEGLFMLAPQEVVPSTTGLSSGAIGAVSEHLVVARLLDLGRRVAIPVVDDDGVDLVVDYRTTVQVKSSVCGAGETYRFAFTTRRPNRADVFVLHGRDPEAWWIVPGDVIRSYGGAAAISIALNPCAAPRRKHRFTECWEYRDAWHVFDER